VSTLVIDASVAVKWVIEETGTEAALSLRRGAKLIAPELLVAECANVLWKKVRRNELSRDEAHLAARLLHRRLGIVADPNIARGRSADRDRTRPSGL
jgi:predicted nucleic acid-binding protein